MTNLLIIGGVAAGATAAARARRLDSKATITILEAGADVSFANCGLPYYLGGDVEFRSSLILASPQTFADQYRVTVHTDTEALSIDREARVVTARQNSSGNLVEFPYDRLILAQGGKPVVPSLPGADGDHVFTLWTLDDMDLIDAFIADQEPATATIVGGGFIGLEMVEALAKRGLSVTLVEMAPHVMPTMEAEFAGALQKELLDYGVTLKTGASVERIFTESVRLSDGSRHAADLVLLSVGVRPTLTLAKEAGLELGGSGALRVSTTLQTSDPAIFAAGDMVEIEHRVSSRSVRVPLAGPANRQGRIAAENALGGERAYGGALGSSVVKVFGIVAGATGLSLSAAQKAGIAADAIVVHKASHTAYYPGSEKVSLMLVFEKESGKILGAQAVGRVGVDKRIDVIATAIAGGLTIDELQELDLAYAPPFNSPNGPVNMAAFCAVNHASGFSPSLRAADAARWIERHEPIVIDLRDPIAFSRAHLDGSTNLSQGMLRSKLERLPRDEAILLISEDGQKGHVAVRMLAGAGFEHVTNLSGGYLSLERHARAVGTDGITVGLFSVEPRKARPSDTDRAGAANGGSSSTADESAAHSGGSADDSALIVDVRTPDEFASGAYPGAINIPLDELPSRIAEFGAKDRELVVYCASGARSSYAERLLREQGFLRVENGGGLHDMMASTR